MPLFSMESSCYLLGHWLLYQPIPYAMGDDNLPRRWLLVVLAAILGRLGAKEIKGEDTGITFKDVAGQEEAKESMQEIVSFLKTPG